MPIVYELDPNAALIRTRCIGAVSVEDVLSHFDTLEADPRATGARLDVLLDLTELTTLPESGQLREAASRIGRVEKLAFAAIAIVTASEALFGMLRMFEVFSERFFSATRVFRERAEADAWLLEKRTERALGA
jgi:hypothetical protein